MDVLTKYKKTCPICGKTFYCTNPENYVYKYEKGKQRVYLCSYTCYRKHEKENPVKYYSDVVR